MTSSKIAHSDCIIQRILLCGRIRGYKRKGAIVWKSQSWWKVKKSNCKYLLGVIVVDQIVNVTS
jgi:uncharacterized membrane protein